ncbi:glycosyltransferase family A protein [Pseudotabrizicola sp. 4114]|uniref:glycosyltransferase family 2 protein n=1 Tax=Pseudotabrizicola sp. 4114 TaxID=2817731 RepID=UPI0028609F23|nr:hypothetical protein [Pseudorhodobacter sp. 4114]
MKLSVIVIMHNMQREAARTLFSLSRAYQQNVAEDDYEIIAIDNGSSQPVDTKSLSSLTPNIRYHFHETSSVSPVEAVNLGAQMATGDAIAVIVDGARMASPGLLCRSLDALHLYPGAFVCALSWHLGPDIQPITIQNGYNQSQEDAMLADIHWQDNGYRLFDVSTLAPSSGMGFLNGFPTECSWFCISRSTFLSMGGFNPAFQTPGGGQCNHDFRNRALHLPGVVPIALLGEGVFHQVHGGVATNARPDNQPHALFYAEHQRIKGEKLAHFQPAGTLYLGTMHASARRFILPRKA